MKTNLIGISGKIGSGKDTVGLILQVLDIMERTFDLEQSMLTGKHVESIQKIGETEGPARVGSNEFQIKKYAEKVKRILCLLIGCTMSQLEDREFKEKELGREWWYFADRGRRLPYTDFLAIFCADQKDVELVKPTPRSFLQLIGTEMGRNIIHPNTWVNSMFSDFRDSSKWIITDVRFPNEVEAIHRHGGKVIRIDRTTGNALIDNNVHAVTDHQHPSETALDGYTGFDDIVINDGTLDDLVEKIRNLRYV